MESYYDTLAGLNVPHSKIYNHLTPSGSSLLLHKVNYLKWQSPPG